MSISAPEVREGLNSEGERTLFRHIRLTHMWAFPTAIWRATTRSGDQPYGLRFCRRAAQGIVEMPVRDVHRHQGLEQPTMRRHAQVQEFVDDDEVLEPFKLRDKGNYAGTPA